VFEYVGASEVGGAAVLSDSWGIVSNFDEYGNVLARADSHAGVDLETTVTRAYANDPATWLVGRMTSEQVCSTALGMTQCRGMELHHNTFGEVWSATIGDPGDPETHLSLVYAHDAYGNLIFGAADDAFGHHRSACISYDAEGIFPYAMGNAAGHIAYTKFDPGLGVRTAAVDANGLVTQWNHDGFGRVSGEFRPDGTSTEVWLTRTKDGGPQGNWWNVKADTFSDGGGESIAEIDMLGRAVRTYTGGPEVTACDGSVCTGLPWFVEEVGFDDLGRVARVSVPRLASSTAAPVHHAFEYDAVGRVVKRTTPWESKTTIAYDQHLIVTTDSAGTSSMLVDALGRTIEVTDKAGNLTQYTHGPFGGLVRVDGPGGEVTSMTRDAYGRVRQQSDPNRGESTTEYDGFGEATHTLDALGRAYAFTYDGLGRMIERDDRDGFTTWKYDTAAHGKGMLAVVTSPAGHTKSFTYDTVSRPDTVTLSLGDTGDTFQSAFTYDNLGHLATIAYPLGDSVAPLTVARDYDGGGNLIRVRDAGTNASLWQLNTVDGAGRTALETFGNGVTTRHEYDGKKGAVTRILTNVPSFGIVGPPPVQDLRYTYDSRLNVTSRQDWLQVSPAGVATERFDYDALDRLTCAWFTTTPVGLVFQPGGTGTVACTPHVEYHANGNIKLKSDVGTYAYDPLHPHAVLTAGSATYAHDAVGNQTQRPDGTVAYTAFDLPASLVRAADGASVTFDYDGDQQRIRKTTPDEETVTFGGLYERVTDAGSVKHRYYVAVGGATLAITRAAGAADEVAYIHPDALGSVDVVTDGAGKLAERRSYDAFGARRNPQWGKPPAAAQASNVNVGFTGHEPDELGLVNMKGRIYDPKLGRFLMTDPLVSRPFFSQSWNAYSYVLNNPLRYVDPTGFDADGTLASDTTNTKTGNRNVVFTDARIGAPGFEIAANISYSSYPSDRPAAAPPESAPMDGASEGAPIEAGAAEPTKLDDFMFGWAYGGRFQMGETDDLSMLLYYLGLANEQTKKTVEANEEFKGYLYDPAHPYRAAGANFGPVIETVAHAGANEVLSSRPKGPAAGKGCSGAACGPEGPCFVAGTLVLTLEGMRPIEDLQKGDVVVSREPAAVGSEWRAASDVSWSQDEVACSDGPSAARRADADRSFDGGAQVPRIDDVVRVLADEAASARYLFLSQVVAGARVAFQGKVYQTRQSTGRIEIRETGETLQRIRQTKRRGVDRLIALTVRTERGEHRVVGTPEHPFYVPSRRAFVSMGALSAGMALLGPAGQAVEVLQVEERPASSEVFNVEVERTHTYFVCDSGTRGCELVHNACPQLEVADAGGGPTKTIPWQANKVGASVCRSGCQEVAAAIQGKIGGTVHEIKPKAGPRAVLGRVKDPGGTEFKNPTGGAQTGWGNHYVVVKDGRAYDLLTGPKGEPLDAYKGRFEYSDAIHFGWEGR
jgi:RHS repeat-associated protein